MVLRNIASAKNATPGLKMLQVGSLLVLILQNTSLVLVLRYARTRSVDMFIATTAVVISEFVKLVFCLAVVLYEQRGSIYGLSRYLRDNIINEPLDCVKISVPAILYTIQNNLVYVSLSHLDTSVFQVSYQFKILTTALFSVAMLGKKLTGFQWLALALLTFGIGIVQMQVQEQSPVKVQAYQESTLNASSVISRRSVVPQHQQQQNYLLGVASIVVACILSGFAGVYFEKLLKHTKPSIYLRNIQLSTIGIVIGLAMALIKDGEKISSSGFWYGYDIVVWVNVLLQSLGGIIVAMVIKYTDNILKGFATSASILLTCFISVFLFDTSLSTQFIFGASLVAVSVYVYGRFVYVPVVNSSDSVKGRVNCDIE